MPKIDYKKDFKALYLPGEAPAIIDVPAMSFLMIDGAGDPNGEAYQAAVSALYALSYTLKMKGKALPGYREYAVFPLEGLWWASGDGFDLARRDDWLWTSMIRQPEFVTPEAFFWARELTQKKKPALDLEKARLEVFKEGLCVQALHIGPYAEEPATVEKMRAFMAANGLRDTVGRERKHHELYLSDPNRAKPESMKTVLRHPAERT